MPKDDEHYCLRLNMSLEELKRATNLWQRKISDVLTTKLGFTKSFIDPGLFTLIEPDGTHIIIICWIDDIAVGYNSRSKMDEITQTLKTLINLNVEDTMERFLNMEIVRNRKARTLTLTQTQYVKKLFIQHLSEESSKSWKHVLPCGTSKVDANRFMAIGITEIESERVTNINRGFLELADKVAYVMIFTRPDISFHITHLARCTQSPSTAAYEAVLNIMHYLYHTSHMGISFGPVDPHRQQSFMNKGRAQGKSQPQGWSDVSSDGRFCTYGGRYVEVYNGPVN